MPRSKIDAIQTKKIEQGGQKIKKNKKLK